MTEPAYLSDIRTSYDNVAASYAGLVPPTFEKWALGRALLTAFAELVEAGGGGPVADLGCGPGHVTDFLHGLGVDAFGIDLSPRMVETAGRYHPDLRFEVGSMTDLDLADGTLGGVVAWYSIVHLPPEALPVVFAEFRRTLAPGGHLFLGFHVGDRRHRKTEGYGGHAMAVDVYRVPIDRVVALAADVGLEVVARVAMRPESSTDAMQALLLLRKPSLPRTTDASTA